MMQEISGRQKIIYASILGTQVNARYFSTKDLNSIAKLDEGTPVEIINFSDKTDGRCFFVNIPKKGRGWILGKYIIQERLGDKGKHGEYFMRVTEMMLI